MTSQWLNVQSAVLQLNGTSKEQWSAAAEPLMLLTCWLYSPCIQILLPNFTFVFHCHVVTSLTLVYELITAWWAWQVKTAEPGMFASILPPESISNLGKQQSGLSETSTRHFIHVQSDSELIYRRTSMQQIPLLVRHFASAPPPFA